MPPARKSFTSTTETPQVNPLQGVTFDLDGMTFECQGRMSFLDMSDMGRRISELPTTDLEELRETDGQAAATIIGSMSATLLMALGDPEYQRFRKHCRDHATPDDVLIEVVAYINGAVQDAVAEDTGRPTLPPQPSLNGPAETDGRISRIVSLQRGDVTVIGEDGQEHLVMRDHQEMARQTVKTPGEKPRSRGRRHTA